MRQGRRDIVPDGASLRIDKWLWFARFAKSRSLAAKLCASGAVAISGMPTAKPNESVRVGDVVSVPQGRVLHTVRVVALGVRRGPASEARRLYEVNAPPLPLAAAEPEWEPLFGAMEEERAETS